MYEWALEPHYETFKTFLQCNENLLNTNTKNICISLAVTYNAISNDPDIVEFLEEKETSLEIN